LSPEKLAKYAEKVVYSSDGLDTVDVSFIPYAYEEMRKIGVDVFFQGFALDAILGGSFLPKKMSKVKNIRDLMLFLDRMYALFSPLEIKALLSERLNFLLKEVHNEFIENVKNAKGDTLLNKSDYFTLTTRVRRYTIMGSVIAREFMEETLPTIDNEVIEVITRIPHEYRHNYRVYKKFLSVLNQKLTQVPYVKTMIPPRAPEMFWTLGTLYQKGIRFVKRAIWKFSRGRIYLPNKQDYADVGEMWRVSPAWKNLLNETILNEEALCYKLGYLNKNFVEKVVEAHRYGIKSTGQKVSFLVTFELFLRMYFGGK